MDEKEFIDSLSFAFSLHADRQRAVEMKAYLRNQFEFLGIQTPTRRSIYKDLPKLPKDPQYILKIANELWEKPEREYR